MEARVGYKVGLEFCDVDVKSPVKTQRCREGRNNLGEQTVEISVRRPFDIKIGVGAQVPGAQLGPRGPLAGTALK